MKTYQHTQKATFILVSVGVIAVLSSVLAATVVQQQLPAFILGITILIVSLIVIAWIFNSLTVEMDDEKLYWRFGPGLIRKRVLLDEIASAKPVRTNVLEGWGIHYSSRFGWLYNVSGFDAVAITLQSGKRFCLGTDEPETLAAQLNNAIHTNV